MFSRTAIAALAICSLAACSKDNNDASTTTVDSTSVASTPTPPPPPQMTDANILAAMTAADSMEIMMGTQTKAVATDAGLKSFAAMMVTDHGKHVKDVDATAKKDNITLAPMAGDTSAQHMQNMKTAMSAMTKGAATDSSIIAEFVNGHQAVIDQLNAADGAAQNADVKALIASTKPVVQKHLDAAKALQDKMTAAATKTTTTATTTAKQ
jgi:putative membrane protein